MAKKSPPAKASCTAPDSPNTVALFQAALGSQMNAALDMIEECLAKCPKEHWTALIARQHFWEVAYHALCFTDFYLAPTSRAWKPDTPARARASGHAALHPAGRDELWNDHPSREFSKEELLRYIAIIRTTLDHAMSIETADVLAGPSGFSWISGPRLDTHLYNLRHIAHHVGQLSASLRKVGVKTAWAKERIGSSAGVSSKWLGKDA